MKNYRVLQGVAITTLVAMALAACGGGGDSGSATKAWGTATLLETDNAGNAYAPQVVFDSSGNALAVWYQSDGTRNNILANRYTAGVGWGYATLIETDNTGGAVNPQVAFDTSGNAFAVWQQSDGTHYNIWTNRYSAGVGWGTAALLETDNSGDAWGPQIAFDSSGNGLAVWQQYDGTRNNIWSNRYTAGIGWGTATLLETDNTGDAGSPQIAFDSSGNAHAVWCQSDGTRYNIWAKRYTVSVGWGMPTLLETDNAGNAYEPHVAYDSSGNALVVWQQSDGTRDNIWANRYTAGIGWGSAVLIESDDSGSAYFPRLAVDNSGNAIAVWQQFDGTSFNILANRYTAGSGWGTAATIESGAWYAAFPQVATDNSGNAYVVWQQSDGTENNNIWANRYTAGAGWGAATLIETDDSGDVSSPQVAVDSSGNALAVWSQSDGTRYNIWANNYR